MSTSLDSHKVAKKIFVFEEHCERDNGEVYTMTKITYMADGLQHAITLFSDKAGLPEFIQTNERLPPSFWFDEDYEGSYQDEDLLKENTDDETG